MQAILAQGQGSHSITLDSYLSGEKEEHQKTINAEHCEK